MQEDRGRADVGARRMLWSQRSAIIVLMVLVTISLLMNVWAFMAITRARFFAREQVVKLAEQVKHSKNEVISLKIPIKEAVPLEAGIPIRRELMVPINMTVPIKDEFVVPIETPFGIYRVPVPVDTTIPVSTTVPVQIDETLQVSTTVDLELTFPVDIPIADTPLAGYLEEIRQELIKLGKEL